MSGSSQFDELYYRNDCGPLPYGESPQWLALFDHIAKHIVETLAPVTVMDAGCAMGLLVQALRRRGVDAWGVDISEYAINAVPQNTKPFCKVGSITDPPGRDFDLIVSIEVLEHLSAEVSALALSNLSQHCDEFLFSSSPYDTVTESHINVRLPEDWIAEFARAGKQRDTAFQAGFVTEWAMLFSTPAAAARRQQRVAQTRIKAITHERDQLRSLVKAYEDGRVMRLLNSANRLFRRRA